MAPTLTMTSLGKQANKVFAQMDGDEKVRFIRSLLESQTAASDGEVALNLGLSNMLMKRLDEIDARLRGIESEIETTNNPNMTTATANLTVTSYENSRSNSGRGIKSTQFEYSIPEVTWSGQVLSKFIEFRISCRSLQDGTYAYLTGTAPLFPNPIMSFNLTTTWYRNGIAGQDWVPCVAEVNWREDQRVGGESTIYRAHLTIDWDDSDGSAFGGVDGTTVTDEGSIVSYQYSTAVLNNTNPAYPRIPGSATHRNFAVRDGVVDNTVSYSDQDGWYSAFFEGVASVLSTSAEVALEPSMVKVLGDLYALTNGKKSDQDVYLEEVRTESRDPSSNWSSWLGEIASIGKNVIDYAPKVFETAWSIGSWLLAFL